MVDFLSIAPLEVRKELVTILDHQGKEQQVEVQAVDNTDLAKLARKNPGLRDLFKQGVAKEQFVIAFIEHAPALVAAALGHIGDERYEDAAKRLAQTERDKILGKITEMSFPKGDNDSAAPLATAEEVIAGATAAASEAQ